MQRLTSKEETLFENLKKIWQYRYLIMVLAGRELKVKYAQASLGLLWAALQPLIGMLVFTLFFDKLIRIQGLQSPYPLFAFSGMLGWNFFSFIVNSASTALANNQNLIQKIYFPKLILPIAKVAVGLVELCISLLVMILLTLALKHSIPLQIVFLPFVIIANILVGLSFAIWLNALTVRNRDLQHIIPYLINFSIWLTPVFYPGSLIPDRYHWLIYCNPMAGVLEGYRWALLGEHFPSVYYVFSFIAVLLLLVSGLLYFKRTEKYIAELL